jgi:hypothetical protein
MSQKRTAAKGSHGIGRVVLYYIGLGVVAALVLRYVPAAREAFLSGRLQELGSADPFRFPDAGPLGAAGQTPPWHSTVLGTISMVGALAVMIPVTWVYMITRRQRGYHESVVHTLLILPVAVTGIVIIVQNSVALAFSLAGIVAAVRFRTTLEDTKDAVYVFMAIGVGLASGVQALGLALSMSAFFNVLILVLWYTKFGNIYADQNTRTGPLGMGDVLAGPASAATALMVGDPAILDAAAPDDLADMLHRAARMERHIAEERAKKKEQRANALILVHAASAERAQTFVDGVLDELASRYKMAEVVEGPESGIILEYLARLDGPGVQGAVVDRLRNAGKDVVTAAELRSLKGLKKRS